MTSMTAQDGLLWQAARNWIFLSRKKAGHNADIWDLRFKWPQEQHRLFNLATGGEYRLSPMNVIRNYAGEPALRKLLHQYLYYSVEDGGEIHTPGQGICRGCSLSR